MYNNDTDLIQAEIKSHIDQIKKRDKKTKAMAGDEYSAVSGGGRLKLKSSKVKDGRVDKGHKKSKKKASNQASEGRATSTDAEGRRSDQEKEVEGMHDADRPSDSKKSGDAESDAAEKRVVYKTEAERKYEEQRKKRVRSSVILCEEAETHKICS